MNLNSDQRRAVEHSSGPLLVLAGPGTGKTGVLISRIVHLIEDRGVEPNRILALTFSRRAAEEMESRLKEASEEAARVDVRTFHSFALRVVKRNYAGVGLDRPPQILPTSRQWQIVREILTTEDAREWNLAPEALSSRATIKEVYDLLLRARENSHSPDDLRRLGEKHGLKYLVRAGFVLGEYNRRLDAASEVDYEQVVQQAIRSLPLAGSRDASDPLSPDAPAPSPHEHSRNTEGGFDDESVASEPFPTPDSRSERSERLPTPGLYDHVLVDEFQDTNRSQLDLVKLLAPGERPNVFCVGDDAQSIYGFRGARAENVGRFEKHFADPEVIPLRANYRSAQPIVTLADAALRVEGIAREREPQILPETKEGSVVREVKATMREEGEWVADRILELGAKDIPFHEIAVLRRSLLDSEPVIEALRSRGVPVDFSNTPARTSAGRLAILLLAADGDDPNPTQASRALVSPLVGVSSESARILRDAAQSSSMSVFEMIRDEAFPLGMNDGDREKASSAVRIVDEARSVSDFLEKLDALWKNLPGAKRLFDTHAKDAEAARAIADTGAFVRAAKAYARAMESSKRTPDAAGFLAAGDPLDDDSDTWAPTSPPVKGAVRVMTVHASKGLEFEAVFVSGLSEGRFPVRSRGVRFVDAGLLAGHGRTSVQNLEAAHTKEERRLFYVALTRAKTYLYLTGVEEPSEDGVKASGFLTDLEPFLASLMSKRAARRFWASRDEAVEDLRRLAADSSGATDERERFAASRALAEMGEHPRGARPWWSYVEKSSEKGASPPPSELREYDLVDLASCPRRAFLSSLTGGGGSFSSGSAMSFGRMFGDAFEAFLAGGHHSFRDLMREMVEDGEFGGPALREHWMREIEKLDPVCDEWARGVREKLVSESGLWEVEIEGRKVRGKHGPVTETKGERVMNKITTSANPMSKPDAEKDIGLSLRSLGADADRGELHYPRKLAYGLPTVRTQGASDGWREEFMERMKSLFEALENGEYPPNPDDGPCGRCGFSAVCPAKRSDESWLDVGGRGGS